MKVIIHTSEAQGSALVHSYAFDNGFCAKWWKASNPFGNDGFLLYTEDESLANIEQKNQALEAIAKYHG